MGYDAEETGRRFAALDADEDGVVTWQDFEYRLLALARADPGIGSAGLFRVRAGFRALWRSLQGAMDADGDERITFEEYTAYHRAAAERAGADGGSAGQPAEPTGPPPGARSAEPDLAALLGRPIPRGDSAGADLAGYHPSGGAEVGSFLADFWDAERGWRYPRAEGFAEADDGAPVAFPSLLLPEEVVDRYGGEFGTYLAPIGTPVAARAIPPDNLHRGDDGHPCNYYRYQVRRDFTVLAGPTAPAFAQAGYGIQYKVKPELLSGGPERPSVAWLVEHGYLGRVSDPAAD